MFNRLPEEYSRNDPGTSGGAAVRSGVGAAAGLAPAREPFKQRMITSAANSVGTHPVASLGVAFVAGILLGKLVKR